MSRDYSLSTIKKIFTLSGNVCAFLNCSTTMIDENLIIIGEICHIEGEKQTSARFNPNMTEQQRRSFDNLILLCPTHHTIVDKDPTNYTANFLKQIRTNHQNKNENMQYNIPDDILKIVNISVNKDEYSAERIHNLLGLYKELQGNETKKTWHDHFEYALKGLKLSSHISQDEIEVLNIVFQDILALKPDESTFQDNTFRVIHGKRNCSGRKAEILENNSS